MFRAVTPWKVVHPGYLAARGQCANHFSDTPWPGHLEFAFDLKAAGSFQNILSVHNEMYLAQPPASS
jgi:hypothetical protein